MGVHFPHSTSRTNQSPSLALLLQVKHVSYLLFCITLPFAPNLISGQMVLQWRVWITIQIIHFLIDVLSSVDGFNLSSLNFSLSFLSMYDDSIFVAILHIQKLYISPSLDCSAVSYSIWGPTYVCKESAMVLFGIAPLWPQLIVIRHGVPIFMM